jgi:protein phosphatase
MDSVTIGAASHPGMKKKENQDYYSYFLPQNTQARKKGILLVLADGMGGHFGGALASKTAVETLITEFYNDHQSNTAKSLEEAFLKANAEVYAKGQAMNVSQGMGTTLTAVALKNDRMYYAHVGDSRGYTIGPNRIAQFTRDHSLVAGLVRAGAISKEEAQTHPDRNVITRAIGMEKHINVDVSPIGWILKKNYYILLCCDGLHTMVSDAEMLATVRKSETPDAACETLVAQANNNGGPDNITVLLARIDKVGLLASWTRRFSRQVRV